MILGDTSIMIHPVDRPRQIWRRVSFEVGKLLKALAWEGSRRPPRDQILGVLSLSFRGSEGRV